MPTLSLSAIRRTLAGWHPPPGVTLTIRADGRRAMRLTLTNAAGCTVDWACRRDYPTDALILELDEMSEWMEYAHGACGYGRRLRWELYAAGRVFIHRVMLDFWTREQERNRR